LLLTPPALPAARDRDAEPRTPELVDLREASRTDGASISRGLTREAYTLDLRQFTGWCRSRPLSLFLVRRAGIESFARELEADGRARATVTRRLCTIAGFCKYAVEEELLEYSPAAHVRRPRVDDGSHAVALDRNELGALLVAAGLGSPVQHALVSLLALDGLRVSEATGADIEHLGLERGHRTLTITRKGGKVVTIPLAPRTARAIDLAIGERAGGLNCAISGSVLIDGLAARIRVFGVAFGAGGHRAQGRGGLGGGGDRRATSRGGVSSWAGTYRWRRWNRHAS
jgi:integrase